MTQGPILPQMIMFALPLLAGALRGRGDSKGPMVSMLGNFVVLRQVYLFASTYFIKNTPRIVAFGYPVGSIGCCITELVYYKVKFGKKE